MRNILICNNYGQRFDGIGDYAKKIYEDIVDRVYTSSTRPDEKFNRLFGLGMSKAMLHAVNDLWKQKNINIIIEYPFIEWNPCICVVILFLKLLSKKQDGKIFITFHEYSRVNVLRKMVILFLAVIADEIMVTEKKNFKILTKINSKIHKIEIPSNIEFEKYPKKKCENQFIFFGLVNKAKAFGEMLEGWDEFNKSNKNKLIVITASRLENIDKHRNIEYIYNADDSVVKEKLLESAYAILPIKPYIDEKNTTFKAACLAGCIPIGVFCDEYKKLDFVLDMNQYTKNDFCSAFSKSILLNSKSTFIIQRYSEKFSLYKAKHKIEFILKKERT